MTPNDPGPNTTVAVLELDCPDCHGNGERGYEPQGWWHGSGVDLRTWPCPTCHGDGQLTPDALAGKGEPCTRESLGGTCGFTGECLDCTGFEGP